MKTPEEITIIGAGRFGTYLASQIQNHGGKKVLLLDKNPKPEDLQKTWITILCVPIRNLKDCLKEVIPHLQEGSLLMDTASVKSLPCQWMEEARKATGREDLQTCGTHPLFGPQSAPVNCSGNQTALCPETNKPMPAAAKWVWQTLLQTATTECTPEEHDKQMATQVINHFLGRTTHAINLQRVGLSTKTHHLFMDIQEIVTGNSLELFEDMNRFNPEAAKIRKQFLEKAQEIHEKLLEIEKTPC